MRTFKIFWRPCGQESEGHKGKFFFNTDTYPEHSLMIYKSRFSDDFIARGTEHKHNYLCWSCLKSSHIEAHKPLCPGRERLYLEVDIADDRDWNQYESYSTIYPINVRENLVNWEDKYWEVWREKNNLETERNEWRTKYYDKNRDYEEEKERREEFQEELDRLKNERLRETKESASDRLRQEGEKSTLRIEKARVEEQLESSNAQRIDLSRRLENKEEELKVVRQEKENQLIVFENKLDQKQQLLETVRQSLKDLEIKHEREKGEKTAEVKEKEAELKRKEEEIKHSKNREGQSREELLNEKSRTKEEKLKAFAAPLGVNLQQINSLRRYYERLVEARKNYNQANIETHEDNIARIEEELSQDEVEIENIQKICRQCEKLAKMRVELNEIRQQQYEARQEVPPHNNN